MTDKLCEWCNGSGNDEKTTCFYCQGSGVQPLWITKQDIENLEKYPDADDWRKYITGFKSALTLAFGEPVLFRGEVGIRLCPCGEYLDNSYVKIAIVSLGDCIVVPEKSVIPTTYARLLYGKDKDEVDRLIDKAEELRRE